MNWRIVFYVIALLSVLLSGSTMAADEFSISSENMVDIPDRQQSIPFGGGTDQVTHISRAKKTENITVTTVGPDQKYKVQLLNPTGGQEVSKTVNDGGKATIEFHSTEIVKFVGPGSYTVAIVADGSYQEIHPVVVKEYDVSVSTSSTTVEKGTQLNVSISVPTGASDPYQVETVLTNKDDSGERERVVATSGDSEETYTAAIPTSKLSEGNYVLSGVVVEQGAAFDGRDNIVGLSDLSDVTIDPPSESSDDGSSDDGSSDDGSSDDGSSDDGSGGTSTGGGGQGTGTGDSSTSGDESEDSAPTPQNIKNTLQLLEPERTSTVGGDGQTAGEQEDSQPSNSDSTSSVTEVSFSDGNQRVVSVAEYGNPPSELEERVIASIVADRGSTQSTSGKTNEDVESTSAQQTENPQVLTQGESAVSSANNDDRNPNLDIVSLSDITTDSELGDGTTARLTLTVDREAVENPSQLTVYKEEYVFESQKVQWVEVEPTAIETREETVALTVETGGFSLFAVTEVLSEVDGDNPSQEQMQSQNRTQTNETEETNESVPGFGWVPTIVAVVTLSIVARRGLLTYQ